jgi:Zn-dependent oligopeptidase
MTSQDGIGSSMGAYLGDEQGQKLADLFKQYAQLISEYSTDVLMHSDKTLTVTKMNDKMDEIATYLSQQNMVWDKATLAGKLKRYSDLLNTEMDAQSPTFGAVNAAMCDATFYQAMDIADTITFGLIKQDPGKFW